MPPTADSGRPAADQQRGRWTRANLRHVATMLRFGANPTARVYDSLGIDPFAAAAPGWLNVGLWDGAGDDAEAPHAPRRLVERLASALPHDGTVVDVGNGLGVQDPVIAEVARTRRIVAVNVTESQLRAGRRHLDRAGARPVVADATRLPLRDASADGVISVEAAFHFPSRAAFFSEVARVLRPGGVLSMSDVSVDRLPHTPAELAAGVMNARFWAIRLSSAQSAGRIADLAQQAGLCNVTVERVGACTVDPFVRYSARRLPTVRGVPPLQSMGGRVLLRQWALLRRRRVIDYLLLRAEKS